MHTWKRIRMKLLDERAGIKKAEEKRKEREAKKFGKQVQIEKQKERERSKKEMTERLKSLKRKRKGALENAEADGEEFDVAVEEAIGDERSSKRPKKEKRAAERRCLVAHEMQNTGLVEKAGDQNRIRGHLQTASSVGAARRARAKEP
ncbi:eukaryotic rRNA processing protein EBP2-domain-containing protein [Pisolithus albus]|nr:eukaryotic rRNA processing protein EBP2-domain-containing protein [Pisolithus albus]